MSLDFENPIMEQKLSGKFFGKYRAFVRDNHDPERLGRLKLEIPAVLGTGKSHWSEWAWPCLPVGGNPDTGEFRIPDEGASVWVEFEAGDPRYPIWSGVWMARTNPGEQPTEATRLCNEPTCLDCEDKLEHKADSTDNPEHTRCHGHPPYYCPRMRVLYKSETGHTILCDDKDQNEYFAVIDRGGQLLEFDCRVLRSVDTGNAERRGERTAAKGDQVDLSKIEEQHAFLRMMDLARQFILLDAYKDKEKIIIQSGDTNRSRIQKIVIDTTKNQEKITISGLNGSQTLVIDCSKGKEKIVITDYAGQSFTMNAVAGQESITLKDKANQTIQMKVVPPMIQIKDAAGSVAVMDGASGIITIKSANKVLINP